ncbi:PAS domain S-box-containing protein [Nocardioides scoriae]|uniref:histidine kinase n=1 Tax=Nocardioides scoriae TaxID=642780 RepID=A0A1H1QP39_9ACTN|nr:PAS domain S-box-containing protein [Nocardioides scoriae]
MALLAAVLGASLTSLLWRPDPQAVATWWPAAGFAVALLALSRRSSWPLLLLAVGACTGVSSLVAGRAVPISLLMGAATALEALVAATVLTHLGRGAGRLRLQAPEGYAGVLAAACAAALTIGLGTALATALVGEPAWASARTVAPSHLAATLVIVPLLLMPVRLRVPAGQRVEALAQGTLFVLAVVAVFWPSWPLSLSFLPLPVLVWAALRLTPYLAALQVGALAVVATASTTLGAGPFAGRDGLLDPLQAGASVQGYLVCAALLAVPTALASAQRAELTRRLAAERELSATTLDTTSAIIVVSDAGGTILQCNATLTRLAGFTPEDVLGLRFWECPLVPPERAETVRRIFADPDGSGVPEFREADVLTASGERLRVVWSNNVVRDAAGQVVRVVCTATDVTSERSTSGLVRHLLEAPVATALVALDDLGRVVLLNHGAEALLGRSEADLVSRPVSTVVTSGHPHAFISGTPVCPGADGPAPGELGPLEPSHCPARVPETHDWTWRHADGTELVVSTTISVVTNVVGRVTGYLCVGRDVTEQRRSQEMLVAALQKERHVVDRLRRLDAAKNDFVSTVSHELRTPTTSIVGYTEMLREGAAGPVSPGQEVMLDAIARNGERLISVASDLLTLAGLESGDSASWTRVPVDLVQVVEHAREAIHPLLADRDLDVDVEVSWGEVLVSGDAAHLDRVAMNLLSNAVKFTPDGGRVRCRLHRDEGTAVLEVSDTGIGIPLDEQDELFTKFFRSSTAQERAIQGTGLGLSIIHSIVRAHGGDVGVRSAHLEGTTFTVRLPLAAAPAAVAAPVAAAPAVAPAAGLSAG